MSAKSPSKAIAIASFIIATTIHVQGQASFQGLGFLPGHQDSFASGISSDGSTVVGISGLNSNRRAFRWTSSNGMQNLGVLLGWTNSQAASVSNDGGIVAGQCSSGIPTRAVRWSGLGLADLGTLTGSSSSEARGISGSGSTVAGVSGNRAFRWTSLVGMQSLGTLPGGANSEANAVSTDGSTIVGWSNSSIGTRPFRWTSGGGMQDLGAIQGGFNQATSVSANGSVVVGYGTDSSTHIPRAFRWTSAGGMENLGTLPGAADSSANDVSEDGSMVVGFSDSSSGGAFFWRKDLGMVNVTILLEDAGLGGQLAGWSLSDAQGITVVGTSLYLAGNGYLGGQLQAYAATIPIPALTPIAFNVIDGTLLRGSLNSLFKVDGNPVFILNDEQMVLGTLEVSSILPSDSITGLFLTVVARATRNDLSHFSDSFNFESNSWVNVNFRPSSLSYVTSNIQISNPGPFVGPKSVIRSRIRVIPTADIEAADGWGEEIDQMTWTVVP